MIPKYLKKMYKTTDGSLATKDKNLLIMVFQNGHILTGSF